jgi:hypothetical protein
MCDKWARRHYASAEEQMTYLICGYVVDQTVRAIADVSRGDADSTGRSCLCEHVSPLGLMTTVSDGHFYGTELLTPLRKGLMRDVLPQSTLRERLMTDDPLMARKPASLGGP